MPSPTLFSPAAALILAVATVQAAAPLDPPPVQLSPFEVNVSQNEGYLAPNALSATRLATPISDLPFAISTFTPQIIADTNSTELIDIARYAAGVKNGSPGFNGGQDKFTIRGFAQEAERNGFYQGGTGNGYVDTVAIDQVEVVKGPASLLYGQIAPGGTVNYITKHAEPAAFSAFALSGGSYNYKRATADINQPVGESGLLLRMNAAWQNDFQWKIGAKATSTSFVPTATWNITPQLSVKVDYQWLRRHESPPANFNNPMTVSTPASMVAAFNGAAGYPATASALANKTGIDVAAGYSDSSDPGAFLAPYPLLPRRYNSSGLEDYRNTTIENETVELDYRLGTHWFLRANADYDYDRVDQYQTGVANTLSIAPPNSMVYNANGTWSVAPSWTALTAAQQVAASLAFAQELLADPNAAVPDLQNGTPGPAVNARRARIQGNWGNSRTLQTEAAGNYEFGTVKLRPLVGLYENVTYTNTRLSQGGGNAASPDFRVWDLDPLSPTYYLNQATPALYGAALPSQTTNNLTYNGDQAIYGLANGSLWNDRVLFAGGARYNRSRALVTNYLPNAAAQPGIQDHYTTPQAGIGFKPLTGLMVYASYSTSYTINTTSLSTVINGASVPFGPSAPTTGKGYDVGVKTDFFRGRVSSTLSFYQVSQSNVISSFTQQVNGASLPTVVQGSQVRGRGVEYEITWSPVDNWQTVASVSEEDIRNTAEPVGFLYYLGAHPAMTAKTLANLWSRYTFRSGPLKNVWLGGGFNYTGRSATNNVNPAAFIPAYTLWNAALGYDWKWSRTQLSAALNWQNLTDLDYQPVYAVPGNPSRIALTLRFRR